MSRRVTTKLLDNKIDLLNSILNRNSEVGSFRWDKSGSSNWQLCEITNDKGGTTVIGRFSSGYDLVEAIDMICTIEYNKINKI